jgi:large subunit ribosomal protein L5
MSGSNRLEETGTSEISEDNVGGAGALGSPVASSAAEAQAAEAIGAEKLEDSAVNAATTPKARRPSSKRNAAPSSSSSKSPDADVAPKPKRAPRRSRSREETQQESEPTVKEVPRLLSRYRSSVKGQLQQEFGYRNLMQVPRLEKVVINIGLGETKQNPRAMENATRDLALISAQKPIITKAKRSIAGFKLREGEPIGTAVTLRGNRMYDFMDRLVNAALPRIRDFRGISRKAFDGRGNYSLGIREQVIFPEIDYGQIDRIRSLQVSIVTTASTDHEAMRLLDLLGMPFSRDAGVHA